MTSGLRALRRKFGITAPRLAVKVVWPWYMRVLFALLLVLVGFVCGQILGGKVVVGTSSSLSAELRKLQQENDTLRTNTVNAERQSQVGLAAQSDLAKQMAVLQDQDTKLKEDLAFYKSILDEGGTNGVLKLHSIKLNRGSQSGEYEYHILLAQSGRHDKMVQGSLQFVMIDPKTSAKQVLSYKGQQAIKINFKYYQRIEGSFVVPASVDSPSVEVQVFEPKAGQPKLTQTLNLPN